MLGFQISPHPTINYLGFVSICIAVSMLVILVMRALTNRRAKSEQAENKYFTFRAVVRPLAVVLVLLSFWLPLDAISVDFKVNAGATKAFYIGCIFSITWFALILINQVKTVVVKNLDFSHKDNLAQRRALTQFRILERIASFLIVLTGLALCLMTFSEIRRIGMSLLASAGVTGIILGLAAQKLIGGMLAGVQLAFTQPIRIDDVVIVENEWGKIEEINLTYVVIRIWDNRRLIVPTNYFIEKPFQNWTRTNSDILGSVFLYVDYQIDLEFVRNQLDEVLTDQPLWDGNAKVVQVTNSTEKCMEVRILVSAESSSKAWDLRVLVREKLISAIQKHFPDSLPKIRIDQFTGKN